MPHRGPYSTDLHTTHHLRPGVDESEAGEFMAECEICHAWQHGTCMGYQSPETMPLHYYCERCRPDLYTELLKCAPLSPSRIRLFTCLSPIESTPNAPASRRRPITALRIPRAPLDPTHRPTY